MSMTRRLEFMQTLFATLILELGERCSSSEHMIGLLSCGICDKRLHGDFPWTKTLEIFGSKVVGIPSLVSIPACQSLLAGDRGLIPAKESLRVFFSNFLNIAITLTGFSRERYYTRILFTHLVIGKQADCKPIAAHLALVSRCQSTLALNTKWVQTMTLQERKKLGKQWNSIVQWRWYFDPIIKDAYEIHICGLCVERVKLGLLFYHCPVYKHSFPRLRLQSLCSWMAPETNRFPRPLI